MSKHEERARKHHEVTISGAAAAVMALDRGGEQGVATSLIAHDEIALLAYFYWEARGCPHGSPEEDWFRAVADLQKKAEGAA